MHFWLHNLAFPVQMAALTMYFLGNLAVEPVLALSAIVIGVGFLCFAVKLWKHERPGLPVR